MACKRALEYVAALAAIAMSIALLAFAISVTNISRGERTQNNTNGNENENGNGVGITKFENNSETQLLIGTTSVRPTNPVETTSTSTTTPSLPLAKLSTSTFTPVLLESTSPGTTTSKATEKGVHIDLPTVSSVVTPVTSNTMHVDNDVINNYDNSIVSSSTTSAFLDPSTIEVWKLKFVTFWFKSRVVE